MLLTFEETNGTSPRYITMNWRNFFECCLESSASGLSEVRTVRDNPPRLFGLELFINPCIYDEVIHLTFERMN